jgi:ElaA protein
MKSPAITWQVCRFDELTTTELYLILRARAEVFVVEQDCPYQDLDNKDYLALHVIGWGEVEGKQEVAAYCRVLPAGVRYKETSIGRVITTKEFRGLGLGKQLLRSALDALTAAHGSVGVRISAQAYLEAFYANFGFERVSDVYMEDNIEHVEMVK